jgi:hypothetical protein
VLLYREVHKIRVLRPLLTHTGWPFQKSIRLKLLAARNEGIRIKCAKSKFKHYVPKVENKTHNSNHWSIFTVFRRPRGLYALASLAKGRVHRPGVGASFGRPRTSVHTALCLRPAAAPIPGRALWSSGLSMPISCFPVKLSIVTFEIAPDHCDVPSNHCDVSLFWCVVAPNHCNVSSICSDFHQIGAFTH